MKLNYKRTFLVGLAFFGILAFWQLYDHVVPLILKYTFNIKDSVGGMVMGIDNVLSLFLLPVFGILSDRTHTRIGRRMPFIIVGSIGGAIALMLLPIADSTRNFWLFVVALGLGLLFMASYRSPAVALMPDVTPKPLRSKGNAIINLMGTVGGMIILVLLKVLLPSEKPGSVYRPNYFPVFAACAAIMLLATLVLVLFVREPKFARQMQQTSKEYGIEEDDDKDEATPAGKSVPLAASVKRSMAFLLASIALWFMGYNAITTSYSKYCVEVFHMDAGSSAMVLLVANAAAVISYFPVAIIATKIGRKKVILAGVAMLAAAFGAAITVRTFSPLVYVLFIVAGIAWASINVNSYPMVVEMAHGADVGKFTGYYYTASMLAQTITPALSGKVLESNVLGYQWLFPYGTLFVALSFITMLFVRHGDAKPVPPANKLAVFEAMDD